ncbi:MAG: class I SAM-dependent methyltransferase [Patescibacteria group bacterium]|nr:class I SAM-dependent methyltransferase [Patescibacteria group bacterium]MDD5294893.1 class I SAM-dependent methyltransferase [Patescibacteria group bacterium]MDD5554053.1 class I SAM-dependent methyltransferase [Patescibacteria group bacterium]
MNYLSLGIQIIIMLLFIVFAVFFLVQFYNIVFRGYAPFISSKKKIIKKIIEKLDLKEDGVIYELGCGSAGFLRAAREKFPKARLVGFEYSFLPYVIAQIQNSLSKSKIIVRKENIFKISLNEADVLYCYLNILTMKRLEDKIKAEGKPGLKIISYQFPLPNIKAGEILEDGKDKVYFYSL